MPTIQQPMVLVIRLLLWALVAYSAMRCFALFEAGDSGAALVRAGFTFICFLTSLADLGWLWDRRHSTWGELNEQPHPDDTPLYRFAGFLSFVLILAGIFMQLQ